MKMKLKLSLLTMFAIFANISVSATDFTVDYLGYNVISFENMTCEVDNYSTSYSAPINAEIPSTVEYNGKTFTVVKIGQYAFSFSHIISVTIPNSVTSIEDNAFWDCSTLKYITIPNSVTSIGDQAFSECSSLTSATLSNGLQSIGMRAFCGCLSLESITIPNSVTSIGGQAFSECSSLTSATLSNGLQSIVDRVFNECSSLESITIPNSVTSIGYRAFYECSSLKTVTIPNSVTSIGQQAFNGCHPETIIIGRDFCSKISGNHDHKIVLMEDYIGSSPNFSERSLNKVISLSIMPPASPHFSNSQIMDLEVLVPTSALPLYQQAEGWKDLWYLKGGAETATGIENVMVPSKETKSCIYNINGMKVEHTVPGEIYIKDGKKFIAR